MEIFNNLTQQLRALWSRWSMGQRAAIVSATVACVALTLGTLYWATRPDYVIVASNLSPTQAAQYAGLLQNAQIDPQLNMAATAVSVPRSQISQARLALKDVIDPQQADELEAAGMFPDGPDAQRQRERRKLERNIAATITDLRGIESAKIHISMPDYSPFIDEKVSTTASVVITPSVSSPMTHTLAESVIAMVARSVKGLDPSNITLLDNKGQQFDVAGGGNSSMDGQLAHQQLVETRLAAKAERILDQLLGPGKANVQVSATIDFRDRKLVNTTYDAEGQVKTHESILKSDTTGSAPPAGTVGITLNTGAGGTNNRDGAKSKTQELEATFDTPKTVEETVDKPGTIKRLTIATIVDLTPPKREDADETAAGDDAAATESPVAPLTTAQIEAIVKTAVGFDEVRGDEITVVPAPFGTAVPTEESPGVMAMWNQYEPIINTIGTGLIASGAFLMGFLMLKRMKPVVIPEAPSGQQLSLDEVRNLATLSEEAKKNPDAAARVLSAWMGVEEEEQEEEENDPLQAYKNAA